MSSSSSSSAGPLTLSTSEVNVNFGQIELPNWRSIEEFTELVGEMEEAQASL